MIRGNDFRLVLVTAPNRKVARTLATAALQERLIACANLIAGVESHFWWEGNVESSPEILLLLKTTRQSLARLEKLVLDRHPYDTPEFVVLSIDGGSKGYLQWLSECCKPIRSKR